jgi:hypothetical protein
MPPVSIKAQQQQELFSAVEQAFIPPGSMHYALLSPVYGLVSERGHGAPADGIKDP